MPRAQPINATGSSYGAIFDEIRALPVAPRLFVLAEGDSWFSLFLNTTDLLGGTNVLWHIDLPEPGAIINLAATGSTLRDMASRPQIRTFTEMLETRYGYEYQVILLSGGGNDVLTDLGGLLRPGAAQASSVDQCLDHAAVVRRLDELRGHLLRLIRTRDDSVANRTTPIIIHTYDYITPRDLPFRFFVVHRGPWAYRALNDAGVTDPGLQKAITDYLLELWAALLLDLQASGAANFHVANTLGTLQPAAATDLVPGGDWHDEIHPTARGFEKLAAEHVNPLIAELLGG